MENISTYVLTLNTFFHNWYNKTIQADAAKFENFSMKSSTDLRNQNVSQRLLDCLKALSDSQDRVECRFPQELLAQRNLITNKTAELDKKLLDDNVKVKREAPDLIFGILLDFSYMLCKSYMKLKRIFCEDSVKWFLVSNKRFHDKTSRFYSL